MPAEGPSRELVLVQQVEDEAERRLQRVERLHVDMQVRAELAAPARSSGRSRRAASSRPRCGRFRVAAAA